MSNLNLTESGSNFYLETKHKFSAGSLFLSETVMEMGRMKDTLSLCLPFMALFHQLKIYD